MLVLLSLSLSLSCLRCEQTNTKLRIQASSVGGGGPPAPLAKACLPETSLSRETPLLKKPPVILLLYILHPSKAPLLRQVSNWFDKTPLSSYLTSQWQRRRLTLISPTQRCLSHLNFQFEFKLTLISNFDSNLNLNWSRRPRGVFSFKFFLKLLCTLGCTEISKNCHNFVVS